MNPSTVLASLPRSVVQVCAALGLDTERVLERAGLRPEELADPDARVSFDAYVALWEALSQAPGSERVGLDIPRLFQLEMLGVIGYVMANSATVMAAFEVWSRYRRLINDDMAPLIHVDADGFVFHRELPHRLARVRQFGEVSLGVTIKSISLLVGRQVRAREVHFQHPRPPNAAELDEQLQCRARYGQEDTRVVFDPNVAAFPVLRPDRGLFLFLERHAANLNAQVPDQKSLAGRVRELVDQAVRKGEPAQAEIARRLAMSERTLQRRLREEGTSFAAILDAVRSDLATRYLEERQLAVYEVAFLLGFAEPSAFFRAFRRWTGRTPAEWRAAVAAPG
jgi:AraC-like DNA-binding protein